MAIYHCSVKVGSRSNGASAVGSCAYREGDKIRDERLGIIHDYSRKSGVIESFTMTPENAPMWASDSDKLWNEVERVEKRKDAQVFREVVVALPRELEQEQQKELVTDYVQRNFVDRGMCATVAIHETERENPHAHIMLTTRTIDHDGFGKKQRDWNQKPLLKKWRSDWSHSVNLALQRDGFEARVDHRSLEDQGIDRTPQIHLGRTATAMERKGIESERGELNREVMKRNRERSEMLAEKEKNLEQERIKKEFEDRLAALPDSEHRIDVYIYDQTNLAHKKNQKRYERAYRRVRRMINKVDASIKSHANEYPQAPTGFFKIFKQEQYKQEIFAWESKSRSMRQREKQLVNRRIQLNELNEKNYQNEKKKLLKDRPEIELKRELVIKQQRKENIERMKKVQQRRALEKDQENELGY